VVFDSPLEVAKSVEGFGGLDGALPSYEPEPATLRPALRLTEVLYPARPILKFLGRQFKILRHSSVACASQGYEESGRQLDGRRPE
jgi:hypothetical protein